MEDELEEQETEEETETKEETKEEPEKEDEIEEEKEIKEEPPVEPMKTLIVYGKEIQVPESKVLEKGIQAYQKELAADKNLEEALRLRKEAEELLKKAKSKEQPSDEEEEEPSKDAMDVNKQTDDIPEDTHEEASSSEKSSSEEILARFQKDYYFLFDEKYGVVTTDQLTGSEITLPRFQAEAAKLVNRSIERGFDPYSYKIYQGAAEYIMKKYGISRPDSSRSNSVREKKWILKKEIDEPESASIRFQEKPTKEPQTEDAMRTDAIWKIKADRDLRKNP